MSHYCDPKENKAKQVVKKGVAVMKKATGAAGRALKKKKGGAEEHA